MKQIFWGKGALAPDWK